MSKIQRCESKMCIYQEEEHSRQQNSRWKDLETGACLVCLGISQGQWDCGRVGKEEESIRKVLCTNVIAALDHEF